MASCFRSTVASLGVVLVAFLFISCGGDGNGGGGTTDPPTTGTLVVTVTADGSARSEVLVGRYAPGSSTAAATAQTGSSGQATFSSVDAGTWEVEITVPGGFALDTGEDERKSVTIVAGQTAAVSFALVDEFDGEVVEARDDLTFSRPNLTITAGTAVRWVSVSQMLHTVTPDGHSEWSAANLASSGSTFTHTFDTPGTYEYFCEPHVGDGMTGTVTVE